ncbi:DUF1127 domain-containing protein [Defluviimonas sp. SAOS-178_SWC]|uniref:DUF1127 domain-containing protein n=1 Tax=Defluviimonas sp. SAOS-178_SWC TaxID=3121287 RepID=UPI00322139FE
MTHAARTAPKLHLPSGRLTARATVAQLGRLVNEWSGRRRSRLALSRLDDRLVRDIGLDRALCEDEALRPFWR